MRLLLASGFLLAFVVVSLLLLVSLRQKYVPEQMLVFEEPSYETTQPDKVYTYADVRGVIETQLLNGPQSSGWRRLSAPEGTQAYQLFDPFPADMLLAELATHIDQMNSPAQLDVERTQGIVRLNWNQQTRIELRYPIPEELSSRRGRIAIIMDDMGASRQRFQQILDLDLMITPAIMPETDWATSGTELMRRSGREYMIHIPMQPRSYPDVSPGPNALLIGQSERQTRDLVRGYLKAVPGAVGSNNHMGSRYTEDAAAMRVVLDELKKHNQFFIDSRTISSSAAFAEARKMGLRTASRNIFLDNKEDVAYIRTQIRKMVSLAGPNQEVIAICHPHEETLQALKQEVAWLKQQPVDFVAASDVVHIY